MKTTTLTNTVRALLLLLATSLAVLPALAQDPFSPSGTGSLQGDGSTDFLPVEQAYPLAVDRDSNGDLLLFWPVHDGYYLYKKRFSFHVGNADARQEITAVFPPGVMRDDEFFGPSEVFYGELLVRLPDPGLTAPYLLEIRSQGCADAGLCYPPQKQFFSIDSGIGSITEVAAPGQAPAESAALRPDTAAANFSNLLVMCLLAAAGGLILNLMPCVFPVLSLKVLDLAESANQDARQKVLHGVVYSAGVVLSFLVVAGLLLALRGSGAAVGWGFHLQAPWFVALLAYLFFAMGLSLSGVLELGSGLMGAGSSLASRSGLSGSFFTGVLATVVASPCTAPFMGTALGFAMTQPAVIALAVFASLGIGMALPFLLLSLFPGLLQLLPRPGPWMLTFRQFLAFPLYAAALWLLWVLGNQTGVNGMTLIAGGTILLAMGLWLWSLQPRGHGLLLVRAASLAVLLAALALVRSPLLEPQARSSIANAAWEVYSKERASELRRAGKAHFVNVTADWCITCLANERFALSDPEVRNAFEVHQLVYLKGDWTNSDPKLTELLRDNGRSGVPLYLLVPSHGEAVILPQLLTPGIVLETFQQHLPEVELAHAKL